MYLKNQTESCEHVAILNHDPEYTYIYICIYTYKYIYIYINICIWILVLPTPEEFTDVKSDREVTS